MYVGIVCEFKIHDFCPFAVTLYILFSCYSIAYKQHDSLYKHPLRLVDAY